MGFACGRLNGTVVVDFGGPVAFDHLVVVEDLAHGQRINGFQIVAESDGREVARGTTGGGQTFVVFDEVRTARLLIEVGAGGGRFRGVTSFLTGHEIPRELETPGL